MLKNIPKVISPELIKTLMEMGHGDEIVIADGNFPSSSIAKRLVQLSGTNVPEVLEAVLKFFPLDTYSEYSVGLMQVVPGDNVKPVIWDEFKTIIEQSGESFKSFEFIERNKFYERAKKAYAVAATTESAQYANIILKKGVVIE